MANTTVNKVVLGNETLIDLTPVTVTADKLASGYTALDASGALITGTATGGGTEAGTVTQDADGYLVLDDEAGSGGVTVEALSVTQNGTYTAPTGKAYSPVTVNVSGGGGGVLKMGVIRPDAELVESWTYDKYIVADENVTIPSYTTSQQTLKSTAVITTPTLDYDTYVYIALVRAIATPKYVTGTTQGSGMQAYFIYNNLYEFVEIPPGTFTYGSSSITNLHHVINTYQSLPWTNIYCSGSSSLVRTTPTSSTACYGANFNVSNLAATTSSTLSIYTPALRLCGNSTQFTQTYWNALEDIRYQYIIQLYRAPKSSGFDGFGYKSQFMHTVQCATSASGTLT